MRFVLDTNVWISATLWPTSVANRLLCALVQNGHDIFISEPLLDELREVLPRDFGIDGAAAENTLRDIRDLAVLVYSTRVTAVIEDPDDNKILEAAMAASATLIITYDKHLLRLKTFGVHAIITPDVMLRRLL